MTPDVPTSTLPMFMDIYREIQATQFGEVNLTITTHRGIPVAIVTNSFRHERFAPGDNSKAMERVIAIAKHMTDTKETGTLSFTLVFNDGEIKEVTNQFYDKKNY
jgi:hypothetical protein